MAVLKIDQANFEAEVLLSDKPVLLDFWADWCGPCRMIAPAVEAVAEEREDIKVGKINVDEQPALASRFGIMTIPTLVLVKGGEVVSQVSGARPKNAIESFIDLVLEVVPAQVTLVPDAPDALTSNAGWDTIRHREFLTEVTARFHEKGIRVSIFVDPNPEMVAGAKACGADRVELYTESYASHYGAGREAAIAPFVAAAEEAKRQGLGLNAGHDLSLENLAYYHEQIPWTDEVSIGHALISDALYLGLENTVQLYQRQLK